MPDRVDDSRVVLTLDAGGTNFMFSAMSANRPVVEPFTLPSRADDLDAVAANDGRRLRRGPGRVAAASRRHQLRLPRPRRLRAGIIGGPGNLPAYRDVALGPMLEDRFGLPVFINNDGDLFA